MSKMTIDTKRWELKLLHLTSAVAGAVENSVKKGSDIVLKKTIQNLSGQAHPYGTPGPSPGELPVTRITSNLKGSMRMEKVAYDLILIFPDVNKAPYAAAVHDGSKDVDNAVIMPRRPYLYEAVRETREQVTDKIKDEFLSVIREYGLS